MCVPQSRAEMGSPGSGNSCPFLHTPELWVCPGPPLTVSNPGPRVLDRWQHWVMTAVSCRLGSCQRIGRAPWGPVGQRPAPHPSREQSPSIRDEVQEGPLSQQPGNEPMNTGSCTLGAAVSTFASACSTPSLKASAWSGHAVLLAHVSFTLQPMCAVPCPLCAHTRVPHVCACVSLICAHVFSPCVCDHMCVCAHMCLYLPAVCMCVPGTCTHVCPHVLITG